MGRCNGGEAMKESQDDSAAPRVPLGGDYWQSDPGVPLWGLADLHAHLMAHLAFGGRAFWGQPYDPDHPLEEGMPHALASCEPIHGGLLDLNPEFGHAAGGGWPDFDIWPRFGTLVHQQAYIDWIYRAYQGGLRLICTLAVNNELLASRSDPQTTYDDRSAITDPDQRHESHGGMAGSGNAAARAKAGCRSPIRPRKPAPSSPKTNWPSCWAWKSIRWATGAAPTTCSN